MDFYKGGIELKIFGEYIKTKREAQGKLISGVADELGLSRSFMGDVEKGRKMLPNKYLKPLAKSIGIVGEELYTFYDLAGEARGELPFDIADYLLNNKKAIDAIRKAINKAVASRKEG